MMGKYKGGHRRGVGERGRAGTGCSVNKLRRGEWEGGVVGGGGLEKMPDWDNLIVRCVANDLIKGRMMGKSVRSRRRSVSV